MGILDKLFGTRSEREVKRLLPTVDKIEALSDEYAALSDEALRAKTEEFKARYQSGETLDDLLPELPPSPYLIRKEKKVQRIRHKKPRTT